MKKYSVPVEWVVTGWVEVQAENEDDLADKVAKMSIQMHDIKDSTTEYFVMGDEAEVMVDDVLL